MAAAQSRVADTERSHYSSALAADPQGSQDTNAGGNQLVQAVRQKADAENRAESCQAAQQEAEQGLKMAQLEVARIKVCQLVSNTYHLHSRGQRLKGARDVIFVLQRDANQLHSLPTLLSECCCRFRASAANCILLKQCLSFILLAGQPCMYFTLLISNLCFEHILSQLEGINTCKSSCIIPKHL